MGLSALLCSWRLPEILCQLGNSSPNQPLHRKYVSGSIMLLKVFPDFAVGRSWLLKYSNKRLKMYYWQEKQFINMGEFGFLNSVLLPRGLFVIVPKTEVKSGASEVLNSLSWSAGQELLQETVTSGGSFESIITCQYLAYVSKLLSCLSPIMWLKYGIHRIWQKMLCEVLSEGKPN